MRLHLSASIALLSALVWTGPLPAQQDTSLIVGTISDASGAVIPGAQVTFAHLATGTEYTAAANESGNFRSPPLRIGEYLVVAESDGFKSYSGSGIVLSIGDVRQLDIILEVGAVTEVIEVEASAPLLQTSEASAGQVIENRQIVDLPLNGRDYLQLAAISSGTTPSRGQGVSIGGQRGTEVAFTLDGMDNNNQAIASQGNQKEVVKPSVDALQEFKVVTNGFSAEYGRSSAGLVILSLKSGTNELHGTGFYFFRDEVMDARNYFTPANRDKPQFGRQQYGFAAGGPIVKNKTFIFGDAEWTDIRETASRVSNVPTANILNGDFNELGQTMYDPDSWNGTERQPFANNIIPESRFDPVTAAMREFWPAPDSPGLTNNFTFLPPRNQDYYKWDIRVDHAFTPTTNFFGRWSSQQQARAAVGELPPTRFGTLTRAAEQDVTSNNAVLGLNKVWKANLVSSFRLGWNYIDTDVEVPFDVTENVNSAIGLQGFATTYRGLAEMNMAPWRRIGNNTFRPNLIQSQTRQFSADNTWTKNKHAVKFGAQMYWLQSFIDNNQRAMGTITFDGRFTENVMQNANGGLSRNGNATGDAMADFLLGVPREMQGSSIIYMNLRAPFLHYYVQDDWKVTQKLTLNMGVRYEYNQPWIETRDGIANFDRNGPRGSQGFIEVAGMNGSSVADRGLVDPDKNNWAPRFGFAYQAKEKIVVRGAYGIFYGNISNTGGGEFMETMPPFHIKSSLTTGRIDPELRMRIGLPPGTISPRNAAGVEMSSFDRDPPWPMAQNWNLNMQFSLKGDMLWEVGYFGNKMNHIIGRFDENSPIAGQRVYNPTLGRMVEPTENPNLRRPWYTTEIPASCRGDLCFDGTDPGGFITLGRQNTHSNRFNSLYHGLQTKLEKRYSKGMTYILSYNWAHAISDLRGIPGSGEAPGENARFVLNPLDLSRERGPAPTDIRHRFVGSLVYELPWGRGKRFGSAWGGITDAVLGGWSVGSIVTLVGGTPATPGVQGNPANVGGGDRPDIVAGQDWQKSNATPEEWWNPAAFAVPEALTYGNSGKGVLRIPGRQQWDFSAYKSFRFSEKYSAQFRLEAFNFTNTPQFNAPNTTVGNRNFGRITGAANPRNLQLGLKFIF